MSLSISVVSDRPAQVTADCLVITANGLNLHGGLPDGLSRTIKRKLRARGFKGESGQTELLVGLLERTRQIVAVIGLGTSTVTGSEAEGIRRGLATVINELRRFDLTTIALSFFNQPQAAELAAAATEGAHLVTYQFSRFSKQMQNQAKRQIKKLIILTHPTDLAEVKNRVKNVQAVWPGIDLARDLVNLPADNMSPKTLAEAARGLAAASPRIEVEVMNRAQAKQKGFNAFLAVAKGSTAEPYVIHLRYQPASPAAGQQQIFLVGKGITFDSGGLSIKPAEHMETMKSDMAGAATILGLFSIIDKLSLNVAVHGVIAACENMPSGGAYRPGDILTAKNGKTIEILNTDAEGRVTLADTLSYAAEHKPTAIIDLATLTGACIVALGETVAGLWSNNDELKNNLLVAGRAVGENIEDLPMPEEYAGLIKSSIADLRNTSSSRYGGAITAAMFLREFVGQIPWAHIDIAGPSYMDQSRIPYWNKGATGWGVRTLAEFLKKTSVS